MVSELSVCFGDDEEKVASAKVKGTDAGNDLAIIAVSLDDMSDDTKAYIRIAKSTTSLVCLVISSSRIGSAVEIGMAYPMPSTFVLANLEELMPITSPFILKSRPGP